MFRFGTLGPLFFLLLNIIPAGTEATADLSGNTTTTLMNPNPSETRHLFYLHGRLIEDQGLPAISPEFGKYEYEAILERFASFGFNVHSEVRARSANVTAHASRTVAQIDSLIATGVLAKDITVVGASKGAYIATLASHLARNPQLNFVLLAGCHPDVVAYMVEHGVNLHGRVLAIRDIADTDAGACVRAFQLSENIGQHEEIVLTVGTGHGIIFKPLNDWMLPTVNWARRDVAGATELFHPPLFE